MAWLDVVDTLRLRSGGVCVVDEVPAEGEVELSDLEELLFQHIKLVGLPLPEREYRFAPPRRYRADFAYPEKKILVEVQGGIYTRGAHSRGTGLERDYEKLNLAQLLGYKVFQFSRKMIESGEAISILENCLKDKKRCD